MPALRCARCAEARNARNLPVPGVLQTGGAEQTRVGERKKCRLNEKRT